MKDKNTFHNIISNSTKETIEIKLTPEECKTLEQCFKDLKEIQPVVYEFEVMINGELYRKVEKGE